MDVAVLNRYEVRIYNGFVREMVDAGEPNVTGFSDYWAEPHYVEITAPTVQAALKLAHRDYPEEAGFVVSGIDQIFDPA